jgi:hypothetical protein
MYFTTEEFACKCGCGFKAVDSLFRAQLEKAREISGVPYIINSGCRCENHNRAVGSTSRNHTSGKAVDIKALNGSTRGKILKGLYRAGFTRVGIADTYIHVDSMDDIESCWLY